MKSLSQYYMFASILLILVPWSTAANVHMMFPLVTTGDEANDDALVQQLFEPSSSVTVAPPPQPRCWFNALKVFQPKEKEEVETLNKMCAKMGPQEQKAFAFEIARCHLSDLGRAIVETFTGSHMEDSQNCTALVVRDSDDENLELCDDEMHAEEEEKGCFPNLKECLKNLTQEGIHAYTYFLTQVVQLCNRLTEHLVADFREHTSMQLAKFSQQAVSQFNYLIQRQQDAFEERDAAARKRHEDFYAAMQEKQHDMYEGQSSRIDEFKVWTFGIMDDWSARSQQQKEQHEAWLLNQTSFLQSKALEWERQHLFTLASLARFLPVLPSLDAMYTTAVQGYNLFASHGYSLFSFLFYLVGVLSVANLLTLPRRCRRYRGGIFTVIFMEGLAEICLYYCMENGLVSAANQRAIIVSLRNSALCFESFLYAVGLVFSCCCCGRPDSDHDHDDDDYEEGDHDTKQQTQTMTHEQHRELMQSEFRRLMQETMVTQTEQPLVATAPIAPPVYNHILPSPPIPMHHHAGMPPTNNMKLPPPPPVMHRRTLPKSHAEVLSPGHDATSNATNTLAQLQIGKTVAPAQRGEAQGVTATVHGSDLVSTDNRVISNAASSAAIPANAQNAPVRHLFASSAGQTAPAPSHQQQQQQQQQQQHPHHHHPHQNNAGCGGPDQLARATGQHKGSPPEEGNIKKRPAEEISHNKGMDDAKTDSNSSTSSPKRRKVTTATVSHSNNQVAVDEMDDDHSTDIEVDNNDDYNSIMDDNDDDNDDDNEDEDEPQQESTDMETGDKDEMTDFM